MKRAQTYLTAEEIYSIYKKYHVPHSVRSHMISVANFASDLCDKFIKKGYAVDKELVINAALLHDVLRIIDFKNFKLSGINQTIRSADIKIWIQLKDKFGHLGHEKAIAKILNKEGYRKIAKLISKHDFFEIDNLKTWEEKILYYSDKRVDRKDVVPLKKRMSEGRKRNAGPDDNLEQIQLIEAKTFKLESEIKLALKRKS